MEITKEQYEQIKNASNKVGTALNLGLITESDVMGYGIRTFGVHEENGKYYLEYTTYDNCD